MLTRLYVDGFKNLADVDVRFGPFTCVAGPNGVGKSNLFDAIAFLSGLADKPLMEAALTVRGGEARHGDVRSLFRRIGDQSVERMRFRAEMLIPESGEDTLGQTARASMTHLCYDLELGYRPDPTIKSTGTLEVIRESMTHIKRSDSKAHLGFQHKKVWRDSVVKGRRSSPYISTEKEGDTVVVSLHTDSIGGKGGGRPRRVPASSLPRTMLSSASNAAEHRTLVLARQEMLNWTQLQLEPSALRSPDDFTSPRAVGAKGDHLPAALHALAEEAEGRSAGSSLDVYAQVANRLSQLVEDVKRIRVEVDDRRKLLSIVMTDRHDTEHVAGALSDGTLRFLALTVMEADPKSRRLLCLEEPENGIHPLRIPAVIELLRDLSVDPELEIDDDNPLRQVIVNTHSPSVVAYVGDDELLVARAVSMTRDGQEETQLALRHLPGTWRSEIAPSGVVTRGELLAYLNPLGSVESAQGSTSNGPKSTRVMEREDLQLLLPYFPDSSPS